MLSKLTPQSACRLPDVPKLFKASSGLVHMLNSAMITLRHLVTVCKTLLQGSNWILQED